MGLARLYTRGIHGMCSPEVVVEVHVAGGLPAFSIVGLPDTEVKESRDRVRSAIQMSGYQFPARRITVNLAPADLPKDSARFDLPIALGVLFASGLVKPKLKLSDFEVAGELSLDGNLRRIGGALAIAYNARESSRGFILPIDSASEANLVGDLKVYPAVSLQQVILHFTGEAGIIPLDNELLLDTSYYDDKLDLIQVRGQHHVKNALEVVASGRHSVLMVGNPGCGKSMLAQRIVTILPPLSVNEAIASASIYSLTKEGFDLASWGKIPFRQPHHTSSSIAIVGGGANPRPGEISLAHNGVLFLDEIAEFEKKVIEVLREPLETKKINLARAKHKVEFLADFQLVAAMNPCPCGNYGHPKNLCKCSIEQVHRYQARLSAPFWDRIDLVIDVPYFKIEDIQKLPVGDDSATIRKRVINTRRLQINRQGKLNYMLTSSEIDKYCTLDAPANKLLLQISDKFGLSARGYYKLLKVARTIADIRQQETIGVEDIAQCMQYKRPS